MAFNVRIYAHEGLQQMKLIMPLQHSEDSVFQLTQPYQWAELIEVGAVAVSSTPNNTARTTILRVEVPDDAAVRYEINPPSRAVAANEESPRLEGNNQFVFAPGWTISLIDAAALP